MQPKGFLHRPPFLKKPACSKPMSAKKAIRQGVLKNSCRTDRAKTPAIGFLHRPPFCRHRFVQHRCRQTNDKARGPTKQLSNRSGENASQRLPAPTPLLKKPVWPKPMSAKKREGKGSYKTVFGPIGQNAPQRLPAPTPLFEETGLIKTDVCKKNGEPLPPPP
jgi:hypothetical protein